MRPARARLAFLATTLAVPIALVPAARAQEVVDIDAGNDRTRRTETTSPARLRAALPGGGGTVRFGAQVLVRALTPLTERPDKSVFALTASRASVRASLAGGYEVYLRADLSRTPSVLDAELSARLAPGLRVDVGRYKTPFSYEFLTSRAGLDFIDRSRVVSTLVPNRRLGAEAELTLLPRDLLTVTAGLFDGAAPEGESANGTLLGVVRVQAHLPPGVVRATGLRATVGVNVAVEDGRTGVTDEVLGARGRTVVGVDGRARLGRLVVAGEWIGETVRGARAVGTGLPVGFDNREGFYATAGVDLTMDHRLLARLDRFDGISEVLGGLNVSLTPAVTTQLNVFVPATGTPAGTRGVRLGMSAQVNF